MKKRRERLFHIFQDLRGEIAKVAKFLNKTLTEEELDKLRDHLKFENLSKNDAVNGEYIRKIDGMMNPNEKLLRKGISLFVFYILLYIILSKQSHRLLFPGKTGDWKGRFSPELNEKIDRWIEKNLAGSDLKFVTELEYQD